MMEHRGYVGRVEYDDDAGVFCGEVLNLRDVITFEGRTVAELRKAFRDSVDDYLEFCATRGESPEKPYSGRFVVRIDTELHKVISTRARLAGKSLNVWVRDVLRESVGRSGGRPPEGRRT